MDNVPLAVPTSQDELYRGRGADILPARPVMTGDVFTGVDIDAEDHDGLVMVLAHPCSMRAGAKLAPRIGVAPIRTYTEVPFERWPHGHFRVFPLPGLAGADDGVFRAVHLLEMTSCRSERLERPNRTLALTGHGIHVLQQRLVFALTRVAVGLDRLSEQAAAVLLEADLEEDWVDELSASETEQELGQATEDFAAFMNDGHRTNLQDASKRTDTVRLVRQEIKTRQQG